MSRLLTPLRFSFGAQRRAFVEDAVRHTRHGRDSEASRQPAQRAENGQKESTEDRARGAAEISGVAEIPRGSPSPFTMSTHNNTVLDKETKRICLELIYSAGEEEDGSMRETATRLETRIGGAVGRKYLLELAGSGCSGIGIVSFGQHCKISGTTGAAPSNRHGRRRAGILIPKCRLPTIRQLRS